MREIKDTQAKVNSVTPLINREEYPCGNALLLVVESKKKGGGKSFNQDQAIDLLVSLVATDLNSEKKWRGFYNSQLQDEWYEYWES